jgi:transcription factor SPN1
MSSTSSSSLRSLPRAPVRRTDSFGEARNYMKRAPSFSVAAKDSDVSSDEEENLRTKQTKKARRGADHRVNKVLPSQDDSPARRPRMNLQRNPSMFGPELPHNRSPQPTTYSQPAPAHLLGQIPAMGAHPHPPTHSPRTPCTQRMLRRMRPFPTRAARRISFSSLGENDLVCEPVDIMPSEGLGNGLGSAFQLR